MKVDQKIRIKGWKDGIAAIQKADPRLKEWIKKLGTVPDFEIENQLPPYEFLVRSIIGQQISGAAARSIVKKFLGHFPKNKINFETLVKMTDPELRQYGLSANKALSLRDLALKITDGTLPLQKKIYGMEDPEIIDTLIPVRGVGVWTVQMLLIFRLGRMDVFPAGDLVVQKGFMRLHGKIMGKHKTPKLKKMISHSEIWIPNRTVVAKLFWAMNDLVD